MMKLITYPNEFGKGRIVVYNDSQLNNLINRWNGKSACFALVYTSQKIIYTPVIDKLFFDLDKKKKLGLTAEDAQKDLRILHKRLMNDNIKHYMQMSGKGFHCFAFTVPYDIGDIAHRKAKVKSAQTMYCKDLPTRDKKVVSGDTRRMFRIPNTYNTSAKRFCIPITENMLSWDIDKIFEYAEKQRHEFVCYGENLLNLEDVEIVEEEARPRINVNVEDFDDDFVNSLLPCTKYILSHVHPDHDQKVAMIADIVFMITLGSEQENKHDVVGLVEKIVWKHCKWADLNSITLTRQQINSIVSGINFGYSCKRKRNEFNMCVKSCNLYEE